MDEEKTESSPEKVRPGFETGGTYRRDEVDPDLERYLYWMSQPPEARIAAVEELVKLHYGPEFDKLPGLRGSTVGGTRPRR